MHAQLANRIGAAATMSALVLAFSLGCGEATAAAPGAPEAPPSGQNGSAFTYQGQLRKAGAPVNGSCNASFSLWDAAAGGAQIGGTVTSATLGVSNGLFTIPLDFGWGAFNGEARWLETAVGCGEAPVTLSTRAALRPAPYAFALPGLRTLPGDNDGLGNPTMNVIGGVANGIVSNTISADSYNSAIGGGFSIRIDNGSNSSAVGGGYRNRIDGSNTSAIGGGQNNRIDNSGGGAVGGGANNRINDGSFDSAIGGGTNNRVDNGSYYSAIGGGASNVISSTSFSGAIGGGQNNRIDNVSYYGAIGGGFNNVITSAVSAMIPGGRDNLVAGDYGFAAGRQARALHTGAFVWGDSTNAPIASTAPNQFVVRAGNGLVLPVDAGEYKAIAVGERYRDNAVVAWGKVALDGTISASFGVSSVAKGGAGVYTVTVAATAADAASLVPMAVAEVDAPPSGTNFRVVMVNQLTSNSFAVYVVNGAGALVNNDFTFMATAR